MILIYKIIIHFFIVLYSKYEGYSTHSQPEHRYGKRCAVCASNTQSSIDSIIVVSTVHASKGVTSVWTHSDHCGSCLAAAVVNPNAVIRVTVTQEYCVRIENSRRKIISFCLSIFVCHLINSICTFLKKLISLFSSAQCTQSIIAQRRRFDSFHLLHFTFRFAPDEWLAVSQRTIFQFKYSYLFVFTFHCRRMYEQHFVPFRE